MDFSLRHLAKVKALGFLGGALRGPEMDLLFDDEFSRPDGGNVGPDWNNPQQAVRLEGGALRISNGWAALSGSYPGNVRIEIDFFLEKTSLPIMGLFICAGEGFWNGYELYAWPGRMELRRYGCPMAALSPSPLASGKRMKLFLEREGPMVRGGIDGRVLLEFLDLEPFPEELQDKVGLHGWGAQCQVHKVSLFRFRTREKLSPLSVGDRLLRRRMYEAALGQYKNALPVLDRDELELARLRSIVCLGRLGRPQEVLSGLSELEAGDLSQSASRQVLRLRFEYSIPALEWQAHESSLSRIEKEAGLLAERSAVLDALGRPDRIWAAKELWGEKRFERVFDAVSSWPESWISGRITRMLIRFLRIIQGPEALLQRMPALGVHALNLGGGGASGKSALDQMEAEARYLAGGGSFSPMERNAAVDELWKAGVYPRRELLDRVWDSTGAGLDPVFGEFMERTTHLDDAYRFRGYADYTLGKGLVPTARRYYEETLKKFPRHGSVSCGCLITLASLDLWEGRPEPARRLAQRVVEEYKEEIWAGAFARLFTGHAGTKEFFHDWDREAMWVLDPPALMAFLALAARDKADGRPEGVKSHLAMIQGIAFPWEAASDAAKNWAGEVTQEKRGRP